MHIEPPKSPSPGNGVSMPVQAVDIARSQASTPNLIAHGDRSLASPQHDASLDISAAASETSGHFLPWLTQADSSSISHTQTHSPTTAPPFAHQHAFDGAFGPSPEIDYAYLQRGDIGPVPLSWHQQHHAYAAAQQQMQPQLNQYVHSHALPGSDFTRRPGYQYHPASASAFDQFQQQRYLRQYMPVSMASPMFNQRQSPFPLPRAPAAPTGHGSAGASHSQSTTQPSTMPSRGRGKSFGQPAHRASLDLSQDSALSYPRGPPRKPKQSGFALWVGNLPSGTSVIELKEHFSKGATKTIESVFLISKSNCAFVNYRTADSCKEAMSRFHESRLRGVRLVCRLRQGQQETSVEPPWTLRTDGTHLDGNASSEQTSSPSIQNVTRKVDGLSMTDGVQTDGEPAAENDKRISDRVQFDSEISNPQSTPQPAADKRRVEHKYFIVKSLTLEDLEASVRDGIWATQSQNEAILNSAFEAAFTVYLIFSVNKSGQYFGYAAMRSPISAAAAPVNSRIKMPPATSSDGPTSNPTPATEFAPKGRVIDDSARGTIFWEADSSSESGDNVDGQLDPEHVKAQNFERGRSAGDEHQEGWGKPFHIEWICTTKLPFHKTRGLRNPWNANREVKIARDCTELEPSVGKRLIELFHNDSTDVRATTSLNRSLA